MWSKHKSNFFCKVHNDSVIHLGILCRTFKIVTRKMWILFSLLLMCLKSSITFIFIKVNFFRSASHNVKDIYFFNRNSKNQVLTSVLCVDGNGDFCQLNLRSRDGEYLLNVQT